MNNGIFIDCFKANPSGSREGGTGCVGCGNPGGLLPEVIHCVNLIDDVMLILF